MTREERAALREQHLKEELEAKGRELAQVQAQNRAAERAKRDKRRQRVGTLADAAGLFVWEDTTLVGLFHALALLKDTPDPVAVLEGLLADPAFAVTVGLALHTVEEELASPTVGGEQIAR
jgi:hypothetical protein